MREPSSLLQVPLTLPRRHYARLRNELIVKYANAPRKIYRRGNDYLGEAASNNSRTPFAHPEGFIEAFANVYLAASKAIAAEVSGNATPAAEFNIYADAVAAHVVFSSGARIIMFGLDVTRQARVTDAFEEDLAKIDR